QFVPVEHKESADAGVRATAPESKPDILEMRVVIRNEQPRAAAPADRGERGGERGRGRGRDRRQGRGDREASRGASSGSSGSSSSAERAGNGDRKRHDSRDG